MAFGRSFRSPKTLRTYRLTHTHSHSRHSHKRCLAQSDYGCRYLSGHYNGSFLIYTVCGNSTCCASPQRSYAFFAHRVVEPSHWLKAYRATKIEKVICPAALQLLNQTSLRPPGRTRGTWNTYCSCRKALSDFAISCRRHFSPRWTFVAWDGLGLTASEMV